MKKVFYTLLLGLATLLVGCETSEPATSGKIRTGSTDSITANSVILKGTITLNVSVCNSLGFGMLVSKSLSEINDREGIPYKAAMMIGNNYELKVESLEPNTKYYYCAFMVINGVQYQFGQVKSFETLEGAKSVLSSTTWKGEESNTDITVRFNSDNTAKLTMDGRYNAIVELSYTVSSRYITAIVEKVIDADGVDLYVGDTILFSVDEDSDSMTAILEVGNSHLVSLKKN